MANKRTGLITRLNRLFRGYHVGIRHKLASSNVDFKPSPSMLGDDFKYILRQTYQQNLNNFGTYDRTARCCILGETKIATPTDKGYETIEDLCKMYPNGEEFHVFSYDYENDEVKLGTARLPHFAKISKVVRVVTDHGELTCTPDHKVVMRDGSKKEAKDLSNGNALMPFYRKQFYGKSGYKQIYNFSRNKKIGDYPSRTYTPEYIIVRESLDGVRYGENSGMHIHHKDFNKTNDIPENLIAMTGEQHRSYHTDILNGKRWSDPKQRENMSKFMKSYYSSEEGKIAKEENRKTKDYVEAHRKVCVDRNVAGEEHPRFKKDLTVQELYNAFTPDMPIRTLAKKLNTSTHLIHRRIHSAGYKDYNEFKFRYENCKVIRVDKVEGEFPVYDLSVDKYHNFAIINGGNDSGICFILNSDYEEMSTSGEISSALDIYAQESATYFEDNQILHITSKNKRTEEILNSLFYDVLNAEFNMHFWIRNLCMYGDLFLLLDINEDNGITNTIPLAPTDIEREEGFNPADPWETRFRWIAAANKELKTWQVIHFRLMGRHRYLPYGTSKIDAARRVWRQLCLLEDAMMAYRVIRSPERRVFYLDVGGIKPDQVKTFMKQQIDEMRRASIVNQDTSNVEKRYNPLSVEEDLFIPVRGGESGTHVDTLPAGQNTTAIEDVEYIHNKLISALGVPRAYLQYEDQLPSKATLSAEDLRFCRSIQQIQKSVISELSRIAIIHLYTLGYDGEKLIDFDIALNIPSAIYELQKLELWRTRVEIAQSIPEPYKLPKYYVYKNIMNLPESDINGFKAMFIEDAQDEAEIQTVAGGGESGQAPSQGNAEPSNKGGVMTPTGESTINPKNMVGRIDITPDSDVIHDSKNIEAAEGMVERVYENRIIKFERFADGMLKEMKNMPRKGIIVDGELVKSVEINVSKNGNKLND